MFLQVKELLVGFGRAAFFDNRTIYSLVLLKNKYFG